MSTTTWSEDGLICEVEADGQVQVSLSKEGDPTSSLHCSPDKLGGMAGALLSASYAASRLMEKEAAPEFEEEFEGVPVPISTLGFARHPTRGFVILTIQCGTSQLGFELPTANLGEIGRALLTLGSETSQLPS